MAAPSAPDDPRVFITHHPHTRLTASGHVVHSMSVSVSLRWRPPVQPNGDISVYHVYVAGHVAGPWNVTTLPASHHGHDLQNEQRKVIYFKVNACTKVKCGTSTKVITANTSLEKAEPQLLLTTPTNVQLLHPYNHSTTPLLTASIISAAYIGHQGAPLYWLDSRGWLMVGNASTSRKLIIIEGAGFSLSADWIGRALYWLMRDSSGSDNIMKYDLYHETGEAQMVRKLGGQESVMLMADPWKSALFWTVIDKSSGAATLMTSDLNGSVSRAVLPHQHSTRVRRDSHCNCSSHFSITPVFTVESTSKSHSRIYVVHSTSGAIFVTDKDGCQCRMVAQPIRHSGLAVQINSLTSSDDRVYWSNEQAQLVQSVDKWTGYDLRTELETAVTSLVNYDVTSQAMPDSVCLVVTNFTRPAILLASTNTSLTLNLSPWQPLPTCAGISHGAVKYTLRYRKLLVSDQHNVKCGASYHLCQTQETFHSSVTLRHLEPFTNYTIWVATSNFYTELWAKGRLVSMGAQSVFTTLPGVPSAPTNVTVRPATPTSIEVSWSAPVKPHGRVSDLRYDIHWTTTHEDGSRSEYNVTVVDSTKRKDTVVNLLATHLYHVRVLAYNKDVDGYSSSEVHQVTTYEYPGDLFLLSKSRRSLTVAWRAPSDDSVTRHTISYRQAMSAREWISAPEHTKNGSLYNATFNHLLPNTAYAFRVQVIYRSLKHFVWPASSEQLTFTTDPDIPGVPDPPLIEENEQRMTVITWKQPKSNGGSPILFYQLICWKENSPHNWTMVYNGTETSWLVTPVLAYGNKYTLRVAAANDIGWSEFSENSSSFLYMATAAGNSRHRLTIVIVSSFSIILLLVFMAVIALALACRRYKTQMTKPQGLSTQVMCATPDLELATLRHLPRITRQETNALYTFNSISVTDEDVAALPHFRRDQLTLTQFLGSGAFGEVFEGIARNILSENSGETRTAVKTLRKGATEQEKEEFLKEALLMSNFKHDRILRLLGVCLDNDPQFIILELMEGGDLLSYLRASRSATTAAGRLTLMDMLSLCVDVARGCKYLEDMHFLHRDLAARNCLVSTSPNVRCGRVKIGDFGLARDIYKSDYYRKEGEGLLPVRWMAPESLIDGVFTTQSDVWSFGVLMWEVLTLGQQPYPARTNIEVLNFVRNAGRLDQPENCPDDLYHLMLKCWLFTPEHRPSFQFILNQLEMFQQRPLICQRFTLLPESAKSTAIGTLERLKSLLVGGASDNDTNKSAQCRGRAPKSGRWGSTSNDCRLNCDDVHGYLQPLVSADHISDQMTDQSTGGQTQQNKYLELLEAPTFASTVCTQRSRGRDQRSPLLPDYTEVPSCDVETYNMDADLGKLTCA